jgi:hypothetical protein
MNGVKPQPEIPTVIPRTALPEKSSAGKINLKAPAILIAPTPPPTLNPAPKRPDQIDGLHAVSHPHEAYFKNMSFSEPSPFDKLCEKIYSNTATLNRLDLRKYPNLPSSDINLIKYFQENNNALDKALSSLESSDKINLNDQATINDTKANLLNLIGKTDSALILLNESLFLDHLSQTTDPKGLSKIRLKQDIEELQDQKDTIQSYREYYKDKDIFPKNKSKGFGQESNPTKPNLPKTNPQETLEQFSNLKSKYAKYNFCDNRYLEHFIFALKTVQDPKASLTELQTKNKKLPKPYSNKQLEKTINEKFVKESLQDSADSIEAEIKLSKHKLESVTADQPKLKNIDTKPPINTEDSFTEKAIDIGVGQFYLDFLNKILTKVDYNAVEKTHESVKDEIKNNYREYLQKLVEYEQSTIPSNQSKQQHKNLTPNEIVPRDLNFHPDGAPQDYPSKLLQFWENVLQNDRASNDGFACLLENERIAKKLAESSPNIGLGLLDPGRNYEYLKLKNFEIRTVGNYNEDRFLIGLQTLAKNRDDLTIIIPNTVGWLNNKLKADVIILKEDSEGIKILAVDCKSSQESAKKCNSERTTPSIAYHPPKSNLYFNTSELSNPNQQLNNDLKSLFNHPNAYTNLPIIETIIETIKEEINLKDPQIFLKPSQNFYQLRDTEEARSFEKTISDALQAKYNKN